MQRLDMVGMDEAEAQHGDNAMLSVIARKVGSMPLSLSVHYFTVGLPCRTVKQG